MSDFKFFNFLLMFEMWLLADDITFEMLSFSIRTMICLYDGLLVVMLIQGLVLFELLIVL